ncbi:MAG: DUF4340 domain-containing protein, partial [Burkholderiales bacterium]|nr:DUF4340 domain-containing protein [Opitutaceae bacterium]
AEPDLVAQATRVRIESAGKTVELARAADGRWTLAGTPVLPADVSRLNRLATDLVTPKIERHVTSNAARIATLDLDSSALTLLDSAGKTLLALDLGKTADGGGRFLRYGDEAKAYLARLNLSLDADPASWRDTTLVSGLKAEDIASVSIGFPDTPAPVVVSRTAADAPWTSPATPAGSQVKTSVLTSQLGNLSALRFTEVKPNLDPEVVAARIFPREITLTTFAGRTMKFALNRAPEPPAPPAPEVKEGETPPPTPPAAPRPVYVEITDSQTDAVLSEAGKTHAFEIGEWILTALPAKAADLFEPVPTPPAASAEPVSATTEPISVTTEPMTATP